MTMVPLDISRRGEDMRFTLVCILIFVSSMAWAQQSPPRPDRLIAPLEAQRNMALTLHVQAEARLAEALEEIEKLRAKIKTLEEKMNAK